VVRLIQLLQLFQTTAQPSAASQLEGEEDGQYLTADEPPSSRVAQRASHCTAPLARAADRHRRIVGGWLTRRCLARDATNSSG